MCGVIVVDAELFRSTCHGRGGYIHDHCLRYRHNYALFYQLLGSNLFTHHNIIYLERNLAPGSIFHHISFRYITLQSFTLSSINQKYQKYLLYRLSISIRSHFCK